MQIPIIIATALGALVIGFFIGRFHTGRLWDRVFRQHICDGAFFNVHFFVRTLTYLHEGRQNEVAAYLESELDGAIVTFGVDGRLNPEQANDLGTRAARVARDYRATHPWQSPRPEIQAAVQKVLSGVPGAV